MCISKLHSHFLGIISKLRGHFLAKYYLQLVSNWLFELSWEFKVEISTTNLIRANNFKASIPKYQSAKTISPAHFRLTRQRWAGLVILSPFRSDLLNVIFSSKFDKSCIIVPNLWCFLPIAYELVTLVKRGIV